MKTNFGTNFVQAFFNAGSQKSDNFDPTTVRLGLKPKRAVEVIMAQETCYSRAIDDKVPHLNQFSGESGRMCVVIGSNRTLRPTNLWQ